MILFLTIAAVASLIAYVAIAVRWPQYVIALSIGLIFSNVLVNAAPQVGVPALGAVPYLLMIIPVAAVIATHPTKALIMPAPVVWLFGFISWGVVSTLFSATPGKSAPELISWLLEGLIFIILLANAIRSKQQLSMYLWVVVAVAGLVGFLVTLEGFTGQFWRNHLGLMQNSAPYDVVGTQITGVSVADEGTHRSSGMIGEPNYFAMYMSCVLPWAVYLALKCQSVHRYLAILCAGSIFGGVLFSYSRGALVALVLAVVLLSAIGRLPRKTMLWAGVAAIAAVIAIPAIGQRMLTLVGIGQGVSSDTQDASARGRASELVAAFRVFIDHFIVGVGPGQFPDYYQHYGGDFAGGVHTGLGGRHAHNLVLGVAAEVGLVGIVLFLGIGAATIHALNRVQSAVLRPAATAAICSLTIYFMASLFLHLSYTRYLWLFLSLAIAVPLVDKLSSRFAPRTVQRIDQPVGQLHG